MKNPLLRHRKIRHADVMLKAGFVLDEGWMVPPNKNNPSNPDGDVDKLIYWNHPTLRMSITIFDYERMTLEKLVKRVYQQAQFWTKKSALVVFRDE